MQNNSNILKVDLAGPSCEGRKGSLEPRNNEESEFAIPPKASSVCTAFENCPEIGTNTCCVVKPSTDFL